MHSHPREEEEEIPLTLEATLGKDQLQPRTRTVKDWRLQTSLIRQWPKSFKVRIESFSHLLTKRRSSLQHLPLNNQTWWIRKQCYHLLKHTLTISRHLRSQWWLLRNSSLTSLRINQHKCALHSSNRIKKSAKWPHSTRTSWTLQALGLTWMTKMYSNLDLWLLNLTLSKVKILKLMGFKDSNHILSHQNNS
jgi:hypothetical protein